MASSWRYGKRSKYRAKVPQDPEDDYALDPKKSPAENVYDIYQALCCRDTRDTKRLYLLNALATLCQQQQQHVQSQHLSRSTLGFTTEELLYCLSACMVHSFTQVRAAALRTIRYLLTSPKDIKLFNSMQMQHLLCRSIDILLRNDDERVQALKLIRKMLSLSPEDISPVLVRCLVSLADSGIEDGDNLLRVCLAILCEFGVLNPTLLIICGGVTSITRNVLECHNPRIAESLCGVLLYLLEWPQTRNISGVRLDCLAAPYCDFTYRLGIMDKNKDAHELRYTSCRLALLSVLRSWTGTIEFCDPSKRSGLKAIVEALYLNQIEVRKAILDLLYELLGLPLPIWTDEYALALQTVDPSDFQDAWLLSNGFVAMEGRSILPSLAARAPNVCEQHMALLLYCFLETGLLDALVEVIISKDVHLSVRTTVLIGKILQLMHTHLPADISSTSSTLPTLVLHASRGNQNAMAAILALQNYQKMLRNRPASCSPFLDSILQGGNLIKTRLFRRDINSQDHQLGANIQVSPIGGTLQTSTLDRPRLDSVSSSDESASQSSSSRRSSFRLKHRFLPILENLRVNRLIKDSNVLLQADSSTWDWEVIITILRSSLIRKMDDNTGKFLKRLVHYFKPSNSSFSHQDFTQGRPLPSNVTAGLDLIDWLLASKELESMRLLTDYFSDVSYHLKAVTTSSRAHDCLFSPQHVNNTMCQQYFLFIGRMCRKPKGISILTNTTIFEHLTNLVCNTDHVCYVKLIVSGLDYSLDSATRKVLEKALTSSKIRSGRLYATQFLVVLLRARITNFEVWGIPLIIQQTKDPDRSVVLAAIDVLEESCHEKYYLEEIVSLWPNLKALGDVGRLLMARYYSLSRGLNHRKAKIKEEIEYWKNGYNKRYVLLVEADTHSSLTLHVRNEDGYYSRRNCNTRPTIIPPNIPPHLYGQMVQTAQGTTALRKFSDLSHLVDIVSRGKCTDDTDCVELKAAIWAVGHASTHSNGIEYFVETGSRIYEKLVILATKCEVYSIRATAFSVLGLISGTNAGANLLYKLNWLSVRHDRNTTWPVNQAEDWMSHNYTPARHHYDDMPPYNYTGIEDQIDAPYYTGSYWNLLLSSSNNTKDSEAIGSSEAQDANTTSDSSKMGEESCRPIVTTTAKSRTLPEGTNIRFGKHQRSLSESKTTDVISIIGGPGAHYQHRIRYNSCTDSNTSGVSSCESVTERMRGPVGDFHQIPLSPIPSMSNLLEIQNQTSLFRRTSLLDYNGYAKLRALRRSCRPVLSESAADIYDIFESNPQTSPHKSAQRRLKVRSLDRQSSLRMYARLGSEELQVPLPTLTAPKFLSQNDSNGPTYAGICLPKNLLDLFPPRNLLHTYISRDIQDQDLMDINLLTAKQQYLNDSLNNEGGDESSVISSLSDVSSVSKRSKWLGAKHGRHNCLNCSRVRRNRSLAYRLDSEPTTCEIYSNASAALVAAGMQATAVLARRLPKQQQTQQSQGQQQSQQQQQQQQPQQQQATQSSSTIQLSDISFNSPESILSEESMPDRLTANIFYNVQRLANPVSAKQSKMALLELKQKHPASFQDICLYSEVCKTLGRSNYRMNARRFLQELFLDLNFDAFYVEPKDIISKKDKDTINQLAQEQITDLMPRQKRLAELSGVSMSEHAQATEANTGKIFNSASTTNTSGSYVTSHKPHLKSQPLASVYETSCENLLIEQSPRLQGSAKHRDANGLKTHGLKNNKTAPTTVATSPICATATIDTSNAKTITTTKKRVIKSTGANIAPPPAAPPPINKDFTYELHIATDDDEDDVQSNTTITEKANEDEVDGIIQRFFATTTQSGTSLTSSQNSDKTTNSNLSSICTIVQKLNNSNANEVTAAAPKRIVNENKIYGLGRFYTLELDLSCTKNKFPITDRRRSITAGKIKLQSENVTSPTESLSSDKDMSAILRGDPSAKTEQPVKRQSYTAGIKPQFSYTSTTDAATTADTLYPTSTYAITKSLAASLAKPIGSLYCEKRLQSAKSEALLTNMPTAAITTTVGNLGVKKEAKDCASTHAIGRDAILSGANAIKTSTSLTTTVTTTTTVSKQS